jgi:hypothetical protein
MSVDPHERSKAGRSPLGTIGIIAFVLGMIGGCGGLFLLLSSMLSNLETQAKGVAGQMDDAQKNAQIFCAQVRVGQLDLAYALASARFKQKVSQEALAQFVESQPTLQKSGLITLHPKNIQGSVGIPDLNADGARVAMAGSLQNSDGRATISVELVKEAGIWKVDELECAGFHIPEEGSPASRAP